VWRHGVSTALQQAHADTGHCFQPMSTSVSTCTALSRDVLSWSLLVGVSSTTARTPHMQQQHALMVQCGHVNLNLLKTGPWRAMIALGIALLCRRALKTRAVRSYESETVKLFAYEGKACQTVRLVGQSGSAHTSNGCVFMTSQLYIVKRSQWFQEINSFGWYNDTVVGGRG